MVWWNQKEGVEKVSIAQMFDRANHGFCPFCGKPVSADSFRDELSRKEFSISGLCQECQDDFFE